MDGYIQVRMDVWIDGWIDRSTDVPVATLNFIFFYNKKIEYPKITEPLHL